MLKPQVFLQIAVPAPLFQTFDYAVPANIDASTLQPGMRLNVAFGRTRAIGILLGRVNFTAIPAHRIKSISACIDQTPIFDAHLLKLLQWAAGYYQHPIGEVLHSALPTLLRQGHAPEAPRVRVWTLTTTGESLDTTTLSRAPKQKRLFEFIQAHPEGVDDDTLATQISLWRSGIKALEEKGVVAAIMRSIQTPANLFNTDIESALALNAAQQSALDNIVANRGAFGVFLLFGETASGKTEVYLQFIDTLLAQNKQVLVLVPEIGLTPQLIQRFSRRFSSKLKVSHSGLSDRERLDTWIAARDGSAQVVLGTRSAVFTPFAALGAIIVDEEHDLSYKQHEGFRYSARDVATRRGQMLNIPVILGSATPALESLRHAHNGQYHLLRLYARAGAAQRPDIQLIDIRRQELEHGLSQALLTEINNTTQAGQQVLLFLNRRGYAPSLLCHDCGWTARCSRCDARLTYHAHDKRLRCHHCAHEQPGLPHCPECQSSAIHHYGQGTERIEMALQVHFPLLSISRIDRDTTRRKGTLDAKLDAVLRKDVHILIGTQMLAKGHHFPDVTLVGVIDADQGLFGADFRTSERLAQLLLQVAGRAGRAEKPGRVLIQTHHPDHAFFQTLIKQDYNAIATALLQERAAVGLPPYAHMALIRAEATGSGIALAFLDEIRQLGLGLAHTGVEIYPAMPAPMEKRAGRFRAHLLSQANDRRLLHPWLQQWLPLITACKSTRRVRWSIDVDPQDVL